MLRGNDARLCLRREVDARRVPHWGVGTVDSLDSRRGAISCLAMVALPPPSSAGEVTGQTRMLFFRHVGKTSSIPPPAGGLTAAIVTAARRRKEYHVVAAVAGHELKTPETENRPGLERLLETTHLELDGKLFVNTQQAPTWHANCRRFDPGGVPGPPSKLSPHVPAQMGRRETEHEGGKKRDRQKGKPVAFVLSCAQVGCACSRGLQASAWEGARGLYAPSRSPARPNSSYDSPGPSFYRRKERAQVYNRRCSSVLTCLAERS
jgi:hypothetical protein